MLNATFLSPLFSAINEQVEEAMHRLAKFTGDAFEVGMLTLAALFALAVFTTFFAIIIGGPIVCYAALYVAIAYILSISLNVVLGNQFLLFGGFLGILLLAHLLRIGENLRILYLNYHRLQPLPESVNWGLVGSCMLTPHRWSLSNLKESWAPFYSPH